MSTATKLAQRVVHTGTFVGAQQQKLAQDAARKVNSHADMLNALVNRSYTALATDSTTASATYATLLTANITTWLATGYLLITFTASGAQITNAAIPEFQITVDGVATKGCYQSAAINAAFSVAIVIRVAVTRGAHVVLLQWKTTNATTRISAATINEEHAAILVQEAS